MPNAQWQRWDPGRTERLERALNISGVGSILLQTAINKAVQLLTLRELGVWATLPRKPGSGDKAYINRRTAGTSGGVWVADTGSATEETGSYAQATFPYRTLLTQGKVTRRIIAQGKTYGDALGIELTGKTEDFQNALEDGLVNGDARFSQQINGLLTLVNAVSAQVVANTTGTGGAGVVLAKLDAAIDKVKGAGVKSDLVIYGSQLGLRKVSAALQAQQQFTNVTEIAGGFRVMTYDGIPLVPSTIVGDAHTWSGSSITDFANGSTTSLVIVNKRYTWIEELTPITVMPLARTSSQFEEFDIFWDGAVVWANNTGAAILGGISNT